MNKRNNKPVLFLLLAFLILPLVSAADQTSTIEQLNGLLERYSMTQVKLEFKPDGTIIRRDGNGNYDKFNLKDIKEFSVEFDGVVGNILLTCENNKELIYYELDNGTRKGYSRLTVISVNPGEEAQGIIDLFKKLQKSLEK